MWLLLVTTVASAISANAGYLYNAPHVPHCQPANIQPAYNPHQHDVKIVQGIQEQDKPIIYSVSYKDYVYLKKDNIVNYNSHPHQFNYNNNNVQAHSNKVRVEGISSPQNIYSNVGDSNNVYTWFAKPLTPAININKKYAQPFLLPAGHVLGHHQAVTVINNVGANGRYEQTNNHLSARGSYSTSNGQSTPTGAHHSSDNYDSYSQILKPTVNNIYAQTLTSPGGSDSINDYASTSGFSQTTQGHSSLNNGFNQVAQVHPALNTGYDYNGQTNGHLSNGNNHVAHVNIPLNNEYSQAVQVNAPLNNGYNQATVSSAGANLNSNYAHNFASSSNFDPNNGYIQSVTSASTNLNTGYVQPVSSSTASTFNNYYNENLIPPANTNLNTGYEQPVVYSSFNTNSAIAPSQISSASGSSNTDYSDTSTGPTHIDLSSGITQPLPVSTLDNSLSQTVSSSSDTLNHGFVNGLVQNDLNAAVNPVTVPSRSTIAPIVHKHIYFHVPPPEIEEQERVTPPPPPPKKNYKILFIKVPSQDSNSNLVRLQQQIAQMQNPAIEHKTLIYVLVKNPEDPKPVVLPKHKPSEHDVFFVKYGSTPFNTASQGNGELDNTGSIKSIIPLQPDLVHGQHE